MANIAHLMARRLPVNALDLLRHIGEFSGSRGVRAYLVGGSVRDLLIPGQTVHDLDVTLQGASESLFEDIAESIDGTLVKRSQFTTAGILVSGQTVDLAMTRGESYPAPGSLPVVRPGSLSEDLARRDFTINSMAVSLAAGTWGHLLDPHGGWQDVRGRRLRILHRDSFRDDPTRLLRAARYSARLRLTLSVETEDALVTAPGHIPGLSAARVRNELERVFREGEAASTALALLERWSALGAIHEALRHLPRRWEGFHQATRDMGEQRTSGVAYGVLGYGLTATQVDGITARLRTGARGARAMRDSAHLSRLPDDEIAGLVTSRLVELLDPLVDSGVLGFAMASGGAVQARVIEYLDRHRHSRTLLTGDDVIALGVRSGPEVGRVLRTLRTARLDGRTVTRDDELALVRKLIAQCPVR